MDQDNDYMELKRHEAHKRLKSRRRDRDLLPLFEAMAQAASDGDDFVYDVPSLAEGLGLSPRSWRSSCGGWSGSDSSGGTGMSSSSTPSRQPPRSCRPDSRGALNSPVSADSSGDDTQRQHSHSARLPIVQKYAAAR